MSLFPVLLMAAAAGAAGYWNPIPQPGEEGYTTDPRHNLRVILENDSPFGSDCDYTHGTRIDYTQAIDEQRHRWWGISLTQNIYTPETNSRYYYPNEHPYAGYMAVGAAYLMRGEDFGASFEFQLGVTGKPSIAQDCQWFIHELGGMDQWRGWHHQIPSEVTLQLTSRQDYRLEFLECECANGLQTDSTIYTREEVGTVAIAAGIGATYRIGVNLPPATANCGNAAGDYGVSLIEPTRYNPSRASYYMVMSGGVKYVARDMFIDGGVFHSFESKCSREPWQGEVRLGFGVRYHGIDYYAGAMYRSPTFDKQNRETLLGVVDISWNW
ncbi:MAG TPA: lipid A deacylase LpxR family protein [Candidatus Akkermansia intestinigallinarum]|uniref:Lipid A deacylase LpxR family protein n=1 Tax=Candidatus Akkermansia intestinigallinarum TaxID=2838431 RepID=A0A9D1VC23_9BACT|nr:lipid A deacylase LpxR family protein [Candidatus Akkermansia intestinigallinarum]